MIRDIVVQDGPEIIRLAEMFFKEVLEAHGVTFSVENAIKHFMQFIKVPGVLALCAEEDGRIVGMIAGVGSAIIFAKELAMQEMVWYVEPKKRNHGLSLLTEFERRAKLMGFKYVMMVGMAETPVLGIYPRLGYAEMQRTFLKELK